MPSFGDCRGCGARMRWVVLEGSEKRMPLDPVADREKGNVRILADGNRAVVLSNDEAGKAFAAGEALFISHFATCPERGKFRRRQ